MNRLANAIQRHAFQAHQGQYHQGERCQPAEGNPHHRVRLPDHVAGNLRVLDKAQNGGIDPHAQVRVVPEIDDVDQQQGAQYQHQVQACDPAQQAAADKIPARNPGQQGHRQHHQDGQAQIETKADAQGFQDGIVTGQRFSVEAGKTEKEHHP
ncbi:hypothetical protein D3C87_1432080 [compost metagenome]